MAKTVISLVGYQGSGKSTLGAKLARYIDTIHVETSAVVKRASGESTKQALAETRELTLHDPDWLGKLIYGELNSAFGYGKEFAVLTGAREVEVHDYLKRRKLRIITLEVASDAALRFKRLYASGKIAGHQQFIEQDLREGRMGVDELAYHADYQMITTEDSNPDKLIKAFVAKVNKTGKKLK